MCQEHYPRNLFIFGTTGSGKTHLAVSLIRKYPDGEIWKPQEIYRYCRKAESAGEEEAHIEKMIRQEHYIIDDLGTDKKTDYSFSLLYEILDARWMRKKEGLIITSNLSLSELSQKLGDDRLSSRIFGMCKIIKLAGKDWRINEKMRKV